MARMTQVVLNRKALKEGDVHVHLTCKVKYTLGVRVGLALIKLGAWICGILVKEEEADNDLV